MSISVVKKFYEMYEKEEVKETTISESGKRKRKSKNDKFHFRKSARIQDEAPAYEEDDHTEENLKAIQKLSVINSVKTSAIEKIMEHEDRLRKAGKKEAQGTSKTSKPVFNDRDFDTFEKEYLKGC